MLGFVLLSCSRSNGVSDDKLGGLVIETATPEVPLRVERAAKEPAELGRALMRRGKRRCRSHGISITAI